MKLWEKACQKILNNMIDSEFYTWPPTCMGVFFQPERPQVSTAENTSDDLNIAGKI